MIIDKIIDYRIPVLHSIINNNSEKKINMMNIFYLMTVLFSIVFGLVNAGLEDVKRNNLWGLPSFSNPFSSAPTEDAAAAAAASEAARNAAAASATRYSARRFYSSGYGF